MKLVSRETAVVRWALLPVLAVIVVASLLPGDMRIDTGLKGSTEHLLAYGFVAAAGALSFPRQILVVALVLALFSGLLEFAQAWVPGRNGRLDDFEVSAMGVLAGIAFACVVLWARSWPLAQFRRG